MKNKEPLFSKNNLKLITNPISKENPITVQVIGICSALAVTVQIKPAVIMTFSVMFVVALSNVIISFLRKTIPSRIRIIVQLIVVATLVIIVNELLKAYFFDVSKQLSVFVGLIITNCIIMGRLEAFALTNKPWRAFLDGIGNSLGYGVLLLIVSFFRELFGSGTIWGFHIIPESFYKAGYENNGLMILPPMALITIGIIIWIQRSKNKNLIEEK